jgi:hypothetical protein
VKIYRQGDVLLVERDGEPTEVQLVAHDGDALVLALGEATGHAHQFRVAPEAKLMASPKGRHLKLVVSRGLTHEEHSPIEIPAGLYDLPRQVEWNDDLDPRVVAD